MNDLKLKINASVKGLNSKITNDLEWMRGSIIFLTVHGSIAYGLNTETSDVDIRGICISPKKYYYGFNKRFENLVVNDPDAQIYDLKKFFALASHNNPNILELMFIDEKFHIYIDSIGRTIIDNRDRFISKQVKETYMGYARAQLHRIKNHKQYLLNPPTHKPTRQEYNLPEKPKIEKHQFDLIKSIINKKIGEWDPRFEPFSESQKIYLNGRVSDIFTEMNITSDSKWLSAARTIGLSDSLVEILQKEKSFENKLTDWKNFCEWKKNRNPKRAALEAKYGYDLKHATQLIRLLKQGYEILNGNFQVERVDDKEELLGIKSGSMTYEDMIIYADNLERKVKKAYENSKLPNQPDVDCLDNLCMSLIEKSHSKFSMYRVEKMFNKQFENCLK
jgi:predicted nucleotidyltransferase